MISSARSSLWRRPSVVALQLLDLSCRGIRLWPPPFWRQRRLIGHADLACARSRSSRSRCARGAGTPRAYRPPCSARPRRATAASRSRRTGAAWRSPRPPGHGAPLPARPSLQSPYGLLPRRPRRKNPDNPFKEDFSNEVMCMSYLYSKLPETGVPPHIGTGSDAPIRSHPVISVPAGLGRQAL